MKTFNMILAAGALSVAGGAASAATYASQVISFDPGFCDPAFEDAGQCSDASRYMPANALGETDGDFYSLGLSTDNNEGSITLGFGEDFTGRQSVKVQEVTFNLDPGDEHREAVDVFAIMDGTQTLLGRLTNLGGGGSLVASMGFEFIKLVDATLDEYGRNGTTSFDGFDVDSVSVSVAPVPLPAAGLLLLGGLGGFAALRRRKQQTV